MGRMKNAKLVIAGAVLYCTGGVIFYIIPALLANAGRLYHASSAQLGLLAAVELGAIALASLTGPFWIGRFSWRVLVRAGAVASLLGQLASLAAPSYVALLAIRGVTGALGEGVLLALSYSLLGRSQNVERAFSVAYAASIVISMICLYASPALDRVLGADSVLIVVAVLSAAAFFTSFIVPADGGETSKSALERTGPSTIRRASGGLALLTQLAWFAGAGGFWSFTEQLAAANSLPAAEIAQAMALGAGAALLGAALALGLNGRFGRTWPTLLSAVIMMASVFAFMTTHRFAAAATELAVFNVFWASGTIYLTAAACAVDETGKVAVLVPAAQTIGMSVGSFVLGRLIQDFGFQVTPWIVAGLLAATLLLMTLSSGLASRTLRANVA